MRKARAARTSTRYRAPCICRFDVQASSLPDDIKQRLLALNDQRLTQDGVIVIKAQQFRTQEANRLDALQRLQELVDSVAVTRRARRATKPTWGSQQRRLQTKTQRSSVKAGRGRVRDGF